MAKIASVQSRDGEIFHFNLRNTSIPSDMEDLVHAFRFQSGYLETVGEHISEIGMTLIAVTIEIDAGTLCEVRDSFIYHPEGAAAVVLFCKDVVIDYPLTINLETFLFLLVGLNYLNGTGQLGGATKVIATKDDTRIPGHFQFTFQILVDDWNDSCSEGTVKTFTLKLNSHQSHNGLEMYHRKDHYIIFKNFWKAGDNAPDISSYGFKSENGVTLQPNFLVSQCRKVKPLPLYGLFSV